MVREADWFEDERSLLAALRRRDAGGARAVPDFAGYDDVHELARGGQGIVYSAVRPSTGARVALKVLREDCFTSAASRLRFEREIAIASTLAHPNVVSATESGTTSDGRRYLAMEFVRGVPLDEYALATGDDGRPACSVEERLRLFVTVCDAVHHAHLRGLIHRDLKPSNIRVTEDGEPRVLDFGLALPLDGEPTASGRATMSGEFVGSLAWASPEQIQGKAAAVDVRSDVYSLGVILYRMLTGCLPYETDGSLREIVDAVTRRPPRPPSHAGALPEDVETIVLRCLAKMPERRYQSVADLARDVRRHLGGEPIEAKRDSAWFRMQRTARRYRAAAIASGAVAVVLVALTGVAAVLYVRASRAEALAQTRLTEANRQTARARDVVRFLERTLGGFDPIEGGTGEPTVRRAIDRAVGRMARELAGQPEVRALVARTLARSYFHLGAHDEADRLLGPAIETFRRQLGTDLPERERADLRYTLADALHTRGLVHHGMWDLDGAEVYFNEAMQALGPVPGPPDVLALRIPIDLATLYAAQGRYDRAEETLVPAVERARRAADRPNGAVGIALDRLARVNQERRRFDAAERLYREALAELSAAYGAGGLPTADGLQGLGSLLVEQNRPDEAIELTSRALAIYTKTLGREHDRCARALRDLGTAYMLRGALERADEHLREALRVAQATSGAENPSVASYWEQLGMLESSRGRYEEAEAAFARAVDLYARQRDPVVAELETARARLGGAMLALGRPEGAKLVDDAIAVLERTVGPSHFRTLIARACRERHEAGAPDAGDAAPRR